MKHEYDEKLDGGRVEIVCTVWYDARRFCEKLLYLPFTYTIPIQR